MESIQSLLDDFRESVSSAQWSKAVQSSRQAEVSIVKENSSIRAVVRLAGEVTATQVVLEPESFDYQSTCRCEEDPCLHLLVAAISARHGKQENLNQEIRYVITDDDTLERYIGKGDQFTLFSEDLVKRLGGVTSGRIEGDLPLVTKEDYILNKILVQNNAQVPLSKLTQEAWIALQEKSPRDAHGIVMQFVEACRDQVIHIDVDVDYSLSLSCNSDQVNQQYERRNTTVKWFREVPPQIQKRIRKGRVDLDEIPDFILKEVPTFVSAGFQVKEPKEGWPKISKESCELCFTSIQLDSGASFQAYIKYGNDAVLTSDGFKILKSGVSVRRDYAEERRLGREAFKVLRSPFGESVIVESHRVSSVLATMDRYSVTGDSMDSERIKGALRPEFEVTDGHLSTWFSLPAGFGDVRVSKEDIVTAILSGRSEVRVKGVGKFAIPEEVRKLHEVELSAASEGDTVDADLLNLMISDQDVVGLSQVKECENVYSRYTLRSYQKEGIRWLRALRKLGFPGAILADDMGLGKSLQSAIVLESPALIVAPKSVLRQWSLLVNELYPELKIGSIGDSCDITICSYGLMRSRVEDISGIEFHTIIYDEAQHVKNEASQTAQAATVLKSKFSIALSGTPIENSLDDLRSVLRIVLPTITFSSERLKEFGVDYLRSLYSKCILRRTKDEVLTELPPRTDVILDSELSKEEKELYVHFLAEAREELKSGSYVSILEKLLRLRQLCVHPRLVSKEFPDISSKFNVVIDKVRSAIDSGSKVLIFSQWTSALDLLAPKLSDFEFVRIDGSMSQKERGVACDKLQKDSHVNGMLLSLKAGGVGLNLTAADHVFFLDSWWNPAVQNQAADRVHRIGQVKPVTVYTAITEDSVEEGILELQRKKKEITEEFFSASQGEGGITQEDLRAILS